MNRPWIAIGLGNAFMWAILLSGAAVLVSRCSGGQPVVAPARPDRNEVEIPSSELVHPSKLVPTSKEAKRQNDELRREVEAVTPFRDDEGSVL